MLQVEIYLTLKFYLYSLILSKYFICESCKAPPKSNIEVSAILSLINYKLQNHSDVVEGTTKVSKH